MTDRKCVIDAECAAAKKYVMIKSEFEPVKICITAPTAHAENDIFDFADNTCELYKLDDDQADISANNNKLSCLVCGKDDVIYYGERGLPKCIVRTTKIFHKAVHAFANVFAK